MANMNLSNGIKRTTQKEENTSKDINETMNNAIKNAFKKTLGIGIIIVLIIFLILLFLSACFYYITIEDAVWYKKVFQIEDEDGWVATKERNETEVAKISINAKINYAKAQYSEAIWSDIIDVCSNFEYIIDDALDNKGYDVEKFANIEEKIEKLGLESKLDLNNCTLAELLWESNDVFKKYLKNAEELEHLINAELVTQYPDIDGETVEQSGLLDGIIKFCRPGVLNEGEYLKYVSEEIFKEQISKYESTGDETVLKYFTIVEDSEGGKVAQIAYGEEEIVELESNDENYGDLKIDFRDSTVIYTMHTKNINYKELACVDKYTLVFNYLWAFMVITDNYDFVKEMADLAYNSEIEITIYDSETTITDVDTYTYDRETTIDYDVTLLDMSNGYNYYDEYIIKDIVKDREVIYTITNIIDTVSVILTKADVWVVNYANSATESKSSNTTKSSNTLNEITVSNSGQSSNVSSFANTFKEKKEKETGNECKITYQVGRKIEKIINLEYNNSYTTDQKIYTSGVATATEKIEDFVELLNKYGASKRVILEISSWLIEILENNENTVRLVDLTKYILNKATDGQAYSYEEITIDWKTLLKFDEFTGIYTGIYGDTVEEKVWYTLKSYGFSDYAVAGVMGNIKAESGFRTGAVEAGNNNEGNGLCQWSYGRKTQLKSYAASKGVEWTDADTQIEFMITEIMRTGPAKGYAKTQWNNSSYNAWKNASSASEAAEIFCKEFERPGIPHMENRKKYAEEFYEKYKGLTYNIEDYQGEVSYDGFVKNTTDSRIIGTFTSNITGKTFYIYNQNKISGWAKCCNRASSMSVVSGYATDTSFSTLYNVANFYGNGLLPAYAPEYFKKYGLTIERGKAEMDYRPAIRAQLQSGGYAIIYITRSNYYGKSGQKWASSAHWLAILGYRQNNNREEIFVSDSGHGGSRLV